MMRAPGRVGGWSPHFFVVTNFDAQILHVAVAVMRLRRPHLRLVGRHCTARGAVVLTAETAVSIFAALLALLLISRAVQDRRAVVVVSATPVSVVVKLSVSVLLTPIERVPEIPMSIVERIERG